VTPKLTTEAVCAALRKRGGSARHKVLARDLKCSYESLTAWFEDESGCEVEARLVRGKHTSQVEFRLSGEKKSS